MKKSVKSLLLCQSVIQTSYVKPHGGEIRVETKVGEARTFNPVGQGERVYHSFTCYYTSNYLHEILYTVADRT